MAAQETLSSNGEAPSFDLASLSDKYNQEREKRMRSDGNDQYIELSNSDRFQKLEEDPWVDHAALNTQEPPLKDGDDVKVIILGAGYGGLLFAVRFIQAGFKSEDIRIVDKAGGWGGTWYYNRYPGLMCDVESYTYLPLLEEMKYMPKHRYSYGPELLEYANKIAKKWDLVESGVFRSQILGYEWDETVKRWIVTMEQDRGPEGKIKITARSQFVVLAQGVLNHPKVAKNLEDFEGLMFHTARWDYSVTGGSPTDPTLSSLKDKRVGIIGTGATAVQAIPQLAKWAKELYVFQRTPSAVDERGQKLTDRDEWTKSIAASSGWRDRRARNLNAILSGVPQEKDLVNDGWSKMKAYKALVGGIHDKPLAMEDIPSHIGSLLVLDTERSETIRGRVDQVVHDKKTAEALKPWYPGWCKRPTFHDDYLPAFNQPNVILVDTDGKGVERATKSGLVVAGKEYPIDVLVLSTGYRSPAKGMGDPSKMSDMTVRGSNRRLLSEKWSAQGATTLHGVVTNGFPNLFLTGPMQIGASTNFVYVQDILSRHCAYIASEAVKRAGDNAEQVTVEVTTEAEENWSMQILMRAAWYAGLGICTPAYTNNEGNMGSTGEEQMKLIRGAPYALGMNAYIKVLEDWQAEGSMNGVVVST